MLTTELEVARAMQKRLHGYVRYHENPNSPPSSDSIQAQRRKRVRSNAGSVKSPVPARNGTPGRKMAAGASRQTETGSTAHHHVPDWCPRCISGRMIPTQILAKRVSDIGPVPECPTVLYVVHEPVCGDCGAGHTPQVPDVKGTSLGPNLSSIAVCLCGNNMSMQKTTNMPNGLFHINETIAST